MLTEGQLAAGDCIKILEIPPLPQVTDRALQRQLYLKARHQTGFRFYILYDKVYRSDVLHQAYKTGRYTQGEWGDPAARHSMHQGPDRSNGSKAFDRTDF